MDEFTLSTGENLIQVCLDEVFRFPDHTSYFGGYDGRGKVAIHCGSYHVRGPLWFSTGEVWQFYTELRKAYDDLAGQARFCSSEGNLEFTTRFMPRGHWLLEGMYREHHHISTRLHFEMTADQTYLVETLAQLTSFVAKYGDNRGIRK